MTSVGFFVAVFSWVEKSTISLSFLGTGLALAWAGFNQDAGAAQTRDKLEQRRGIVA